MQQEKEKLWAGEVFAEFEKKMEKVAEKSKDKIPALAIDGVHDDRGDGTKEWRADDGLNWWTNGFWGGMEKSPGFRNGNWMPVLRASWGFIMMWDLCGCPRRWRITG